MEIKKGYTLSQFVDLHAEKWALVRRWNDFLKQPLEKSMFINEYDVYPNDKHTSACLPEDYNEFEEAKKKVIFDGEFKGDYYINNNIKYNWKDLINYDKSISELFEATKGELKLKNISV